MSRSITGRALLAATAAAFLATTVIRATAARAGSLARVDVHDRTAGASLPIYGHAGHRYIEGRPGNEYAIRIRNCTNDRLLAVLSVDGVNAVTGETAALDQSGYVIEPGGYVTVEGWRKSLDRTAAFYFTDPGDSYAARTGRPKDLGVIGVALFRERPAERRRRWSGSHRNDAPAAQEGTAGSSADLDGAGRRAERAKAATHAAQPSLGTGHGRSEYSPVWQVEFERAGSRPDEVVLIRYERHDVLIAMGVLPGMPRAWREPDPFPGAMSFVPDP